MFQKVVYELSWGQGLECIRQTRIIANRGTIHFRTRVVQASNVVCNWRNSSSDPQLIELLKSSIKKIRSREHPYVENCL
jgi:hypothetical protein